MRYSIFGYLIGEGFRNVFKNKKSTIASLIIMCATMFIFGIFYIVGENVNHITEAVEQQQGMRVFIYDEATEEQVTELGNKIRNLNYVNKATYVSKEEGLEEVKRMFKERKDLLSVYEGEGNPFKASYVVTLTDLNQVEEVQKQIETEECVAEIVVRSETIDALLKLADGVKVVTITILVILIFISIFIITNTIKLTVHARRKEISIMKYVGATNGFIRWPFMVEGMLIGIIAVLICTLIFGLGYGYVAGRIEESLARGKIYTALLSTNEILGTLVIIYLVLGIGIGALGSAISMRKYLDV